MNQRDRTCLLALSERDVRWLSDVLFDGRLLTRFGACEEISRVRHSVHTALGNGSRDADGFARSALEDALASLDAKLTLFKGECSRDSF